MKIHILTIFLSAYVYALECNKTSYLNPHTKECEQCPYQHIRHPYYNTSAQVPCIKVLCNNGYYSQKLNTCICKDGWGEVLRNSLDEKTTEIELCNQLIKKTSFQNTESQARKIEECDYSSYYDPVQYICISCAQNQAPNPIQTSHFKCLNIICTHGLFNEVTRSCECDPGWISSDQQLLQGESSQEWIQCDEAEEQEQEININEQEEKEAQQNKTGKQEDQNFAICIVIWVAMICGFLVYIIQRSKYLKKQYKGNDQLNNILQIQDQKLDQHQSNYNDIEQTEITQQPIINRSAIIQGQNQKQRMYVDTSFENQQFKSTRNRRRHIDNNLDLFQNGHIDRVGQKHVNPLRKSKSFNIGRYEERNCHQNHQQETPFREIGNSNRVNHNQKYQYSQQERIPGNKYERNQIQAFQTYNTQYDQNLDPMYVPQISDQNQYCVRRLKTTFYDQRNNQQHSRINRKQRYHSQNRQNDYHENQQQHELPQDMYRRNRRNVNRSYNLR